MPEAKRQRRKDARPDEIILAALAEFAENGFAGTSMGSIALRAGIARPTIYLYFDSKDAIFEAAVLDRMGKMVARANDILSHDAPFDQILENVLRNYYDRIVGTDASILIRVLIAEGARFPTLSAFFRRNMLGTIETLLSDLAAKGIASGEVRAEIQGLDLKVIFAPAVFTMIFGLIFGEMAPAEKERFIRSHVTLLLHGLKV